MNLNVITIKNIQMSTSFIREATSAVESIELDLKGFSFNQAVEFINKSFEDERTLKEMIRVTLIVGAGKIFQFSLIE